MTIRKAFQYATMTAMLTLASCTPSSSDNASQPFIGEQHLTLASDLLTPEALWAMGRVGSYDVNPTTGQILYSVSYYSVAQNSSHTVIYCIDADGSNRTLLTTTSQSESAPCWINQGAAVAYLSGGRVYTMHADGSAKKAITPDTCQVEGFKFSPNGKRLLYVACVPYTASYKSTDADLPLSSGIIVEDLMYKHWDEWVTAVPHPFVVDVEQGNTVGEPIDLLAGTQFECPMRPWGGVEQLAWHPNSEAIAYACRKKTGKAYAFSTDSDIYMYSLADGTTTNLCKDFGDADLNAGYDNDPAFSPDGQYIAWTSMERDGYESDRKRLCVMNLNTHRKVYVTERFQSDVEHFCWGIDSQQLYFTGVWHGVQMVYSTTLGGNVQQLTTGAFDYTTLAATADVLITKRHSISAPDDLYTLHLATGNVQQLTQENQHLLSQLTMGDVQARWIPTTDGKEMLAWVIYPPHFDPQKQYPTLLYCQGGPQNPVSQFWSYRWNFQIMAAHGYIVIAPNRRGLQGFGMEWLEAISGDYSGQCIADYLSAIDDIACEPYVDKAHLGCVGASFGGYSVYYLAGCHNKRFAAFIAHDGLFNIEQQYLETEEMWFVQKDLGGAYWEHTNPVAQRSAAMSPHRFVDKWDTPILCIHGEKDYRILASQGMSAFNAAVIRGVPAQLLIYPDENHWVVKPQNGVLWQRTFFRWLDKWLKTD